MMKSLKYFREENNYSQNAVASWLGISRQMYIKYETGVVEPPLKVVTQLARFYRVPYDVMIDDKIPGLKEEETNPVPSDKKNEKEVVYKYKDAEPLKIASPESAYGAVVVNPSYYLTAILDMLPKLIYSEQLNVLSVLATMVQKETENKMEPNKKMQAYQRLLALNKEVHLNSHGKKWTREELYER